MRRLVTVALGVGGAALVGASVVAVATAAPRPRAVSSLAQATFAMGAGEYGQQGDGGDTASSTPSQVDLPSGVTLAQVSAGGDGALGLTTTGSLLAWGDGGLGQLGLGAESSSALPVPVDAPAGTTFTQVAAGDDFDLALSSTGTLYAWGDNRFGQLGTGDTVDHDAPVPVDLPAGATVSAISAGDGFALALSEAGVVYAWGRGDLGQLGDGTTTDADRPQPVTLPTGFVPAQVSAGGSFALVRSDAGTVVGWGENASGQLGDGVTADALVPVAVALPAGVVATSVAAGGAASALTDTQGRVWDWGSNVFGQLGDATTTDLDAPQQVALPPLQDFVGVAGGNTSTYAWTAQGQPYVWGGDYYGQLGDGATTDNITPEEITLPALTHLTGVDAGPGSSAAFFITAQAQTVTLPPLANVTYGAPPEPVAATDTSGLPVTLSGSGACTADGDDLVFKAAGPCTVTASQPGDLSWDEAPSQQETIVVAPAPLTVTAHDIRSVQGRPLPAFTYTVTGFVNRDSTGVLSGSADCASPASADSPAGLYPIVCYPGSLSAANYTVATSVPASLTLLTDLVGYDVVGSDGSLAALAPPVGGVAPHGSLAGTPLDAPVVGAAFTPSHDGYWMAAADGGVFSFGDAPFEGSMGGRPLTASIVGMAASPAGRGYWLVAADGGIFSFGTARFHGSMGGRPLAAPIVGMAATPDGGGYWLVAADGGVFSFGDARYHGSLAAAGPGAGVVGLAPTPDGGGYWVATSGGVVAAYGDADFEGDLRYLFLSAPITSIAAPVLGQGYWLLGADGSTYAFGAAPYEGNAPAGSNKVAVI